MRNASLALNTPALRRRSGPGIGTILLIVFGAFFLALFAGAAAGIGHVLLSIMLLGMGAGLFLLSKPVWMMWLLLAIVLVLNGMAQFFVGFHQLQWIASGLGMALLLVGALRLVTSKVTSPGFTPLSALVVVFLTLLSISTAINYTSPLEVLVGLRTYLPFWGVFFVVHSGVLDEKTLRKMMYAVVVVAAIQWPVELYQKLFVASERASLGYFGSAWDSIVGTFGGAKFGGGASGSLAVYVTAIGVIATAWWKAGFMRTSLFAVVALTCLLAVGLSETKAVFILLPVGLFVLYRRAALQRPGRFLVGVGVMGALLAVLLFGYYKLFWEEQHKHGSVWRALENRFAYSFDPTFMPAPNWPGRLTGLVIWGKKHDLAIEPLGTFIGHGAGSATSFSTIMGPGEAVRRFGPGLDVTGATKLLWEAGVVGTACFLALFVVGYRQSGRLSEDSRIPPWHRATMTGIQASMPMLALAIFYEVTVVSSPPMQFLGLFCLGFVGYWYRATRGVA